MGNAAFIYYPEDDGPARLVDFGQGLQNLTEEAGAVATVVQTMDGVPTTNMSRVTLRVSLSLDRYAGTSAVTLTDEFHALQNHLDRGGVVAFTKDTSKAWCGIVRGAITQGDTSFRTDGNGFGSWYPSAALASADRIVIEEAHPGWKRDIGVVSSVASNRITVSSGVRYTFDNTIKLVRHHDFYPVLWRPESERGRPLAFNDHRATYSMSAVLEYSVSYACKLFDSATWDTGMEAGPTIPFPAEMHPFTGQLPLADATVGAHAAPGRTLWVASSRTSKRWGP